MAYSTSEYKSSREAASKTLHETYILKEYQKLFGKNENLKKRLSRKEIEAQFLSALIASVGSFEWEENKTKYKNIPWRCFKDKRHQVLWRALLEFDMPSFEERLDILIKETEESGKVLNLDECTDRARPDNWLEQELESEGVLKFIGGRKFLRDLMEYNPVSLHMDFFAKKLKFI